MPKAGRQERGLQVYAFGRVSVIVDNAKEEIFAQEGGKWVRTRTRRVAAQRTASRIFPPPPCVSAARRGGPNSISAEE